MSTIGALHTLGNIFGPPHGNVTFRAEVCAGNMPILIKNNFRVMNQKRVGMNRILVEEAILHN
jgi:hypothetical protein